MLVAFVMYGVMILFNTLANTLPINGINTGEVSFKYPNLFQPTGMTFSIWGVIYLLLLVFLVAQASSVGKPMTEAMRILVIRVHVLFALSSLLNVLWLLSWHYDRILLSTILMLMLLFVLGWIAFLSPGLGSLARTSFSVYFGWITVATIANITILLVKLGVPSFGRNAVIMTALILLIGVIIAGLWIIRQKDIAYGLVILWAYLGILIRHISTQGFQRMYPWILGTVSLSIVCVILALGYSMAQMKG